MTEDPEPEPYFNPYDWDGLTCAIETSEVPNVSGPVHIIVREQRGKGCPPQVVRGGDMKRGPIRAVCGLWLETVTPWTASGAYDSACPNCAGIYLASKVRQDGEGAAE